MEGWFSISRVGIGRIKSIEHKNVPALSLESITLLENWASRERQQGRKEKGTH